MEKKDDDTISLSGWKEGGEPLWLIKHMISLRISLRRQKSTPCLLSHTSILQSTHYHKSILDVSRSVSPTSSINSSRFWLYTRHLGGVPSDGSRRLSGLRSICANDLIQNCGPVAIDIGVVEVDCGLNCGSGQVIASLAFSTSAML